MAELLSIGIPFYNNEKHLGFAILSVMAQTYDNWELILIDDGSNDNSLTIAKSFEKIDRRIKVFSDRKNLGLPYRLNQTINLSSGKYYFRMDADDIMHPNRLQIQYNYLTQNPRTDLVGSGLISIDNQNNILGIRKGVINDSFNMRDIIQSGWCVHPTIAGKTSWFKMNPYDTKLRKAQDFDLWLRTIDNSTFKKIDQPLLFYREASSSTIKKYILSTKFTLKIYFKNRAILGYNRYLLNSLRKLVKLAIYILFAFLGQLDVIIGRRYNPLSESDKKKYSYIIDNITLAKHRLQFLELKTSFIQ